MARIQLRRDTTANWTTYNPILAEGEQGLDLDTGDLYIGDGASSIAELTPFTGNLSDVYSKAEVDTALLLKADVTSVYTKDEVYTKAEVDTLTLDTLNELTDVDILNAQNDQLLAFDNGQGKWVNKNFYGNKFYQDETAAKVDGNLNEGDVYYNANLAKALIVGNYQIPSSKSAADASSLEVYFDQGSTSVTVKDVISLSALKTLVAASSDFEDFQSRIDAL